MPLTFDRNAFDICWGKSCLETYKNKVPWRGKHASETNNDVTILYKSFELWLILTKTISMQGPYQEEAQTKFHDKCDDSLKKNE